MTTLKGSELVLQVLEKQGVKQIFGYPGGAIMPLYDALYNSPIKHYLFRHEQGAGFAAIGYARATGKVGVCIATSGPGVTNLITCLADAMLESVPIIAITGQVATQLQGTDAFQEADILGLSLAVTKHSFLATELSELQQTLNDGFAIALGGRPGPVLVDFSKDIQLAQYNDLPVIDATNSNAQNDLVAKAERLDNAKPLDNALLAQAKILIASAQQPVLYVGGGVGMANAVKELRDFQTACDMPSVTTLKGIGTLDNDNKNFLGMLGMHGNAAANIAVQDCDLLLAVGARFDDRVTGQLDSFAPHAKIIHLDIDSAEANKLRHADVAIHVPLQEVLPQLAAVLSIDPWRCHCQQLKETHAWQYSFDKPGIYAPAL